MQKSLALIAKHFKNIYRPTNNNLITSSNTRNKNVDTSPRTRNEKQTRQFRNQRIVTVAGNRETIEMSILDSSYTCDNERKADQNVNEPEDKRVMLASLIAKLKLDVDENKMKHKQLKKADTSLSQELEK
ncbi:hypothetical protein Tco_0736468 [Tanacetum coccineum]